MKSIYLLRHGKSDWSADYDGDHDRPLARRGVRAAGIAGRLLSVLEEVPDRVLTSSARRAADTVRLAAEAGSWACPVDVVPELYEASRRDVLRILRNCPDAADRVLLAGHEPTWSSVAAALTGGSDLRFPTAALARIDVAIDRWRDVRPGGGTLLWLVPPRLLARLGLDPGQSNSS